MGEPGTLEGASWEFRVRGWVGQHGDDERGQSIGFRPVPPETVHVGQRDTPRPEC